MRMDSKTSFWYISLITILSMALILVNMLIGMKIPFVVEFLIGFVGVLLVFVVWHAVQSRGLATGLLMLVFSYVSAFVAEMLGVNFGLVFGSYHYTSLLGVQVLGVPLLAGLAWGPITYGAYHLSEFLLPMPVIKGSNWTHAILLSLVPALLGAFATTAWDLVIDVVAVDGGWWVWHDGGAYLSDISGGIPISNFTGWLGLSFFIQIVFRLAFVKNGMEDQEQNRYAAAGPLVLYGALFLTSVGVSASVLANAEVSLIGVMAMGPLVLLLLGKWLRNPSVVLSERTEDDDRDSQ